MKYKVIREFKCKYSRVRYYPGDVYEHDDADRITFLRENGYLGEEIKPPSRSKKKVKADAE